MLRRIFCVMAILMLAGLMLVTPALAQDAKGPWRINNIPLDLPLNDELNGEFLEGIYQEKLMDRLISSVLNEWPIYHIDSTLKAGPGSGVGGKLTKADSKPGADTDPNNEQMQLFFSSAADQNRIFWIRTHKPIKGVGDAAGIATLIQSIESGYAKADRVVTDAETPGNAILIIVDTSLPADDQARLRAALPDPLVLSHDDFVEFWSMDLQRRARILGKDFRGALAILNGFQGKLESLQVELLDLKRAQTVLNLGQ